ncbi:PP2C family protein-serine/threonine phosphatase [Actinokineospora sp. 24-640]
MASDSTWYAVLDDIICGAHLSTAERLVALVNSACERVGMSSVIYLADMGQHSLRPVEAGREDLVVDGTMAGRAFRFTEIVPAEGVLWMPMVDGTDRVGVLRLELPADADPHDPTLRARCWTLAGLVGHVVVAKKPYGDLFHRVRRTVPLTVAGELLWQLLPPQTFACAELVVSAVVEPFHGVAGDAFDYAVSDTHAYLALFDATGHDLRAGLLTSTVLAATRNARRAGADLPEIAAAADRALAEEHPTSGFCTAVLIELDLRNGRLHYLLAGHPPPVVLRDNRVVKTFDARPRVPFGVDGPAGGLGTEHLEPGDRLLLYTDGITEARSPSRELFGLDRLVDLTERHESAQLPAPETLRRITHAVLEHQSGTLQDDATLMLVEWSTSAAARLLPRL